MTVDERLGELVREALTEVLSDRRSIEAIAEAADRPLAVDVREAARLLGVSPSTVRKLLEGGHLQQLHYIGQRVLIPRISIEDFVEQAARPDSR